MLRAPAGEALLRAPAPPQSLGSLASSHPHGRRRRRRRRRRQVRNRYALPVADGRLIDRTAIIVTGRPIPAAVAEAAAAAEAGDPDAEAPE